MKVCKGQKPEQVLGALHQYPTPHFGLHTGLQSMPSPLNPSGQGPHRMAEDCSSSSQSRTPGKQRLASGQGTSVAAAKGN